MDAPVLAAAQEPSEQTRSAGTSSLKRNFSQMSRDAGAELPSPGSCGSMGSEGTLARVPSSDCCSLYRDETCESLSDNEEKHVPAGNQAAEGRVAVPCPLGMAAFDVSQLAGASLEEVVDDIRLNLDIQSEMAEHTARCARVNTLAAARAAAAAAAASGTPAAVGASAPAAAAGSSASAVSTAAVDAAAAAAVVPPSALDGEQRSMLVGWMGRVVRHLGLPYAVGFTATSLLDRFLACRGPVPPERMLQLLALACLSVSIKYDEVEQLGAKEWLYLAVDECGRPLYTAAQLRAMELMLLASLGWRLRAPTPHTFLLRFVACRALTSAPPRVAAAAGAVATEAEPAAPPAAAPAAAAPAAVVLEELSAAAAAVTPVATLASRLAELTLSYDVFLPYQASTVALACLAVAERLLTPPPPPPSASAAAGAGAAAGSVAAAAVASATGLPLSKLAPRLEECALLIEHAFGLQPPPPATAAH